MNELSRMSALLQVLREENRRLKQSLHTKYGFAAQPVGDRQRRYGFMSQTMQNITPDLLRKKYDFMV